MTNAPSPGPPPAPPLRLSPAALVAIACGIAVAAFLGGRALPFGGGAGPAIAVRPSPNVIVAIRELSRLETTDYHVERVIELAEDQERLFGLVHAQDALLLVAAGDVVAGVDLAKLKDGDADVDCASRRVRVHLPAPEVFSVTIDNARTRVVSRTTDVLATRQEALEGHARAEAESSMRKAALEAGVLDRAKANGVRDVTKLLRALGFEQIVVE